MNGRPSFFAELKRRNVYKVAVAYAIVGWLLIQVATATFPVLEIPNWAYQASNCARSPRFFRSSLILGLGPLS